MDEQVLRWCAKAAGGLLVVLTISLFFLPKIREREVQAQLLRAQQAKMEESKEKDKNEDRPYDGYEDADDVAKREAAEEAESSSKKPVAQEPIVKQAGTIQKTAEPVVGAQLKMQLPPGVDESNIKIENDYMNRTVYISFPCSLEDYFSGYKVLGSDDGIDAMAYSLQKQRGVIELKVDQVYEVTGRYMEEELYMSLHKPREIYDKIVVIDAGHGGEKPGAVRDGVKEKDLALMIVQLTKGIFDLDNGRVGVFYTRLKDENPELDERVALANDLKADLFVSVHINTSSDGKNTQLHGTQILYRSGADDDELFSSKRFAKICLDQMVQELGSSRVGLFKGNAIRIIRGSTMPVALIEVGFMSNPDEFEKLRTLRYQQSAAQAIHDAILRALDEGF